MLEDVVYVAEGAFDAISLLSAGYNACAIFGLNGMRRNWCKASKVVLCLDSDGAGQTAIKKLAYEGVLFGKKVFFAPKEYYKGCKDFNELWRKHGAIDLGAWIEKEQRVKVPAVEAQNEPEIDNLKPLASTQLNKQEISKGLKSFVIDVSDLSTDTTWRGMEIF